MVNASAPIAPKSKRPRKEREDFIAVNICVQTVSRDVEEHVVTRNDRRCDVVGNVKNYDCVCRCGEDNNHSGRSEKIEDGFWNHAFPST